MATPASWSEARMAGTLARTNLEHVGTSSIPRRVQSGCELWMGSGTLARWLSPKGS